MIVSAYWCLECEEFFREPEGPLYECDNCGTKQIEERRCESCGKFMSKLADLCHADCEGEEIEEREAWQGADGELYESEQAELEPRNTLERFQAREVSAPCSATPREEIVAPESA